MHRVNKVLYVAFDEAHFVWQWSTLRACYGRIGSQRNLLPGVPHIAVTATATVETQTKVMNSLKMENAKVFKESINRNNIKMTTTKKEVDSVSTQIFTLIQRDFPNQTGLIYMQTINECKVISIELKKMGLKVKPYYSSLPIEQKQNNQKN